MKRLFKSYPTQSHNIPSNPTIISLLLYIYIISTHIYFNYANHKFIKKQFIINQIDIFLIYLKTPPNLPLQREEYHKFNES